MGQFRLCFQRSLFCGFRVFGDKAGKGMQVGFHETAFPLEPQGLLLRGAVTEIPGAGGGNHRRRGTHLIIDGALMGRPRGKGAGEQLLAAVFPGFRAQVGAQDAVFPGNGLQDDRRAAVPGAEIAAALPLVFPVQHPAV